MYQVELTNKNISGNQIYASKKSADCLTLIKFINQNNAKIFANTNDDIMFYYYNAIKKYEKKHKEKSNIDFTTNKELCKYILESLNTYNIGINFKKVNE